MVKYEQGMFVTNRNKSKYCFLRKKEAGTCDNCHVWYRSKRCESLHRRSAFCQSRSYCELCQRVYVKKKNIPHSCEKAAFCSVCFEYYDNRNIHFCSLEKQRPPAGLPSPIAAYDLETQVVQSSSSCIDCLEIEQRYLTIHRKLRSELRKSEMEYIYCNEHKDVQTRDSVHECNLVTVMFENVYYGHFDLLVLADPILKYEDDMILKKGYLKTSKNGYYDPDLYGKPISRKIKNFRKGGGRLRSSKNSFPIKMDNSYNFEIGSEKDLSESDLTFLKTLQPLEKFIAYFINPRFANSVFLAHYGSHFDVQFLIDCLLKYNISPEILSRGRKVLKLSIPEFNITFIDSFRYIKSSLAKAAKTFDLNIGKGEFPVRFNSRSNYNAVEIPPFPWFVNENDNEKTVEEKKQFWLERKKRPWNFCEEFISYGIMDVNLLAQICVRFCKEWIESQAKMQKVFNKKIKVSKDKHGVKKNTSYFFPFDGKMFCTLGAFSYGMFRFTELNDYPIYALQDERGNTRYVFKCFSPQQ